MTPQTNTHTPDSASLNFNPFTETVSSRDISDLRANYEPEHKKRDRTSYIALGFIWFFLTAYILADQDVGSDRGMIFLGWCIVSVLIGYGIYFLLRLRYKKLVRLKRFADANGLTFKYDSLPESHQGCLFEAGHSRLIQELLVFNNGTEVGNYQYVTGSGKSRQVHNWTFIRIKLERTLPHMVLDAKSNNFLKKFTNLPIWFDRSQTLSLEGDFNNYFTLYAPKQYERDALYIFTPDVMSAIVDNGSHYDMEVVDKDIYLYKNRHFDFSSKESWDSILSITNAISSELLDQSKHYSDERVANKSQNIVSNQGARLRKGIPWFIIVIFILLFALQIFF